MTALTVSEQFGPTVQGEGPSAGRRAMFLRLGLCNLDCGKGEGAAWACDTPYTWDWDNYDRRTELRRVEVEDIAAWFDRSGVDLLVITGGEPLVQQRHLTDFAALLPADRDVEVETNGTLEPDVDLAGHVTFNVSPKLPNSGVSRERAIRPDALEAFVRLPTARFKFVCASVRDLCEVSVVVGRFGIHPSRVWVMPAGTDTATLTRRGLALADEVVARGWNLTPRLHIYLWGDTRGT